MRNRKVKKGDLIDRYDSQPSESWADLIRTDLNISRGLGISVKSQDTYINKHKEPSHIFQ